MEIVFYIISRIMLVACLFGFAYIIAEPESSESNRPDIW